MISCRDAHHLFDRYLDGELPGSLQTELHAHRLQCTACQNQLAMMEACGDVVALDRREPTPSASFTDRVLLARRATMAPVRPGWWRTLLVYGSPVAAAASIALAMLTITPPRTSTIAGITQAAPVEFQKSIKELQQRPLSPEAERELINTPPMSPTSFMEAWLAPVVQKSKDTIEGTRRGAEGLAVLFQGLAEDHEILVKHWNSAHPQAGEESTPAPVMIDGKPLDLRFGRPFVQPAMDRSDGVFDPL